MTTQAKWKVNKMEKTYCFELCQILSLRSNDFFTCIFPHLPQLVPSFVNEINLIKSSQHDLDPLIISEHQTHVKEEIMY